MKILQFAITILRFIIINLDMTLRNIGKTFVVSSFVTFITYNITFLFSFLKSQAYFLSLSLCFQHVLYHFTNIKILIVNKIEDWKIKYRLNKYVNPIKIAFHSYCKIYLQGQVAFKCLLEYILLKQCKVIIYANTVIYFLLYGLH